MQRLLVLGLAVLVAAYDQPDLVPPTVDDDPELPALELEGSRFHVERTGLDSGTPIIFLAGGPGNDFAYLRRLDETCDGDWLGSRYSLVWWDQRGCGQSRRHDDGLNLQQFREDLDALVDAVDPSGAGVVLVGHSWGGMFATDFTNRSPERVRGLVLIEPGELTQELLDANPTPEIVTPAAEWVNDFAWAQELVTLDDHERFDLALLVAARGAQGSYRINREEAPTVRLGGAVIRSNFDGEFYPDDYDFTTDLDRFTTEVLIIAGDTPTSDLGRELQLRQLDVFVDPTLEVLEGSGHTDVVWADGCRSAGLISAYLERIEAER